MDKSNGNGMLIYNTNSWSYSFKPRKYLKRINELDGDDKERFLYLIDKTNDFGYSNGIYDKISMHGVDYGDSVTIQVDGQNENWDDIPSGFELERRILPLVKKVLDVLEFSLKGIEGHSVTDKPVRGY